jgi:excisionase family DNA binding protein
MSEEYISVDAAAELLEVTRGTVWKWVKRFELPTFRILGERRTMLRRVDVERLREPMPIDDVKKCAA